MNSFSLSTTSMSIFLPIRLNPRRGHQTGSGEPSAGVIFFFIIISCCAMLVVLVVSERRASACLIMLSAKQGSHWYHFYRLWYGAAGIRTHDLPGAPEADALPFALPGYILNTSIMSAFSLLYSSVKSYYHVKHRPINSLNKVYLFFLHTR